MNETDNYIDKLSKYQRFLDKRGTVSIGLSRKLYGYRLPKVIAAGIDYPPDMAIKYDFQEQVEGQKRLLELGQAPYTYEAIAELYAKVFQDPPWNEYTRCEGCGSFFGEDSQPGQSCEDCGDGLTLAYPIDTTSAYTRKELMQTDAGVFLAYDQDKIVGFCWGYPIRLEEFIERKYQCVEMQRMIAGSLTCFDKGSGFFYISECGVDSDYRERGIATVLVDKIIDYSRYLYQNKLSLVRTNRQSPMASILLRSGLQQVDIDDVENTNRVLFIG